MKMLTVRFRSSTVTWEAGHDGRAHTVERVERDDDGTEIERVCVARCSSKRGAQSEAKRDAAKFEAMKRG